MDGPQKTLHSILWNVKVATVIACPAPHLERINNCSNTPNMEFVPLSGCSWLFLTQWVFQQTSQVSHKTQECLSFWHGHMPFIILNKEQYFWSLLFAFYFFTFFWFCKLMSKLVAIVLKWLNDLLNYDNILLFKASQPRTIRIQLCVHKEWTVNGMPSEIQWQRLFSWSQVIRLWGNKLLDISTTVSMIDFKQPSQW